MDTANQKPPFLVYVKRGLWDKPAWVLAALCAAILGGAYLSQYGFGLHPCHLCLLQRYPYWAAIGLGVVAGLLWKRRPAVRAPVLWLFLALFLVEAGIASYHAGVEWGLIPGPAGCTLQQSQADMTPEQLLESIKTAPLVSCSQPAFVFLGLSMAGWNALAAFSLSGLTVAMLRRNKKKKDKP